MDPISLIVAALVAGVAAGTQETAATVVKDAYGKLKSLLKKRFGSEGEASLESAEHQASADPAPLAEQLRANGADRDAEILAAAKALLEAADPEGARQGKYQVQISGGKGIVVGDNATTTMNFGADGD